MSNCVLRRRVIAVGAVVAALALTSLVPPASAVHLGCNATVTGTVVLDANIGPCVGDGLIVDADKTTIDLNGFTIEGGGSGTGILVERFEKVTITSSAPGGTIKGFDTGVHFERVGKSKIVGGTIDGLDALTVSDNAGYGIALRGSSKNRIQGVVIAGNGLIGGASDGLSVNEDNDDVASTKLVISENFVIGNGDDGIDIDKGTKMRVLENTVEGNGDGTTTEQDGIELDDVTKSRVLDNIVSDSEDAGIRVEDDDTSKNRIERNDVTGNGAGIVVEQEANKNRVRNNIVQDNETHGVFVGTLATQNVIQGNTTGAVESGLDGGNAGDGILIDAGGNTIKKNASNRNGDDGIEVLDNTNVVKLNVANENGDDGITAVAGTAGGGNSATGNGGTDCDPPDLCA